MSDQIASNRGDGQTPPGFDYGKIFQCLTFMTAVTAAAFALLSIKNSRRRQNRPELGEVADAIREICAKPDDKIAMRSDYQITVDMIKKLMEIRFQCLTFMTAITAAAFALLSKDAPEATRLVIGFLGMCATLGIAIYELRNSQIYDAAMHRAKFLEKELNLLRSTNEREGSGLFDVGLFGERPPYVNAADYENCDAKDFAARAGRKLLNYKKLGFVLSIKHDRGLALIYAAVLGCWSYLAIEGMLAMHSPIGDGLACLFRWAGYDVFKVHRSTIQFSALVAALGLSVLFWWGFVRHDETRLKRPPGPMPRP